MPGRSPYSIVLLDCLQIPPGSSNYRIGSWVSSLSRSIPICYASQGVHWRGASSEIFVEQVDQVFQKLLTGSPLQG